MKNKIELLSPVGSKYETGTRLFWLSMNINPDILILKSK